MEKMFRKSRFLILLLFTAFSCFILPANIRAQTSDYDKYLVMDKYDSIIYLAEKKINNFSADYYDYFWLSVAQDRKGHLVASMKTLEEANRKYQYELIEKALAEKYYQTGNYPKAKLIYLSFISEGKPIGEWIFNLTGIYEFENRYDSTIHFLKVYYESDNLNYRTLIKIAENYNRMNQPDSTIRYLLEALELTPENYYASRLLTGAYLQTEKYDSALNICEIILAKDSLNLTFLKLKAFAYYQSDRKEEAARNYAMAVSLGDSSVLTYKRLGLSLIEMEEYDSAVNTLDLALKKDTSDYELYVSMGTAMARTLEKTQSLKYFDRALNLMEPDTSVVAFILENKANVIRETLSYPLALDLFLQVNELKPGIPRILYAIGDLYMAQEDYEKSIPYFEEIIRIMEQRGSPGNLKSELIYNLSKRNIRYIREEKFFKGEQ